ncbi:uncharacterized protein LOC100904629 [Galendromus occidentalis]|uniref:Uncharacterized protein LOC100904629 n=1 Tax=Galendromus occidentalis TaxID=34638 RepID=A0AAJ6W077_9ACAR|nr:uncharacterized protein LOC100904629 [Galendromus occidentalis]
MVGATVGPFVPAGSRHSHHANTKMQSSKKSSTSHPDEDRRRSQKESLPVSPRTSGENSSRASHGTSQGCVSRFPSERTVLQEQLERFYGEIGHLSEKVSRVQKEVEEASVNLRMLRELLARLESFGGKDFERAELQCRLIRTQLDGLEHTAKTMPHYYPSYPMFNDLISTLKKVLAGHEYVTQASKEKNDMLRENDKLRNEIQVLREEMDKLKRKHVKDKKTINELEKLSSSRLQDSSSLKMFSPQHNSSSTQREDDLKLIEMLREVKTALQDGQEFRGNKDYSDVVCRLKEAVKPDRLDSPKSHEAVASMDSYFRILEKNISLINHELDIQNNN